MNSFSPARLPWRFVADESSCGYNFEFLKASWKRCDTMDIGVCMAKTAKKKPKAAKLNPQQIAFCHHYLASFNATQAAKDAGYSERSAYSIGHDLLKKPEIQKYISDYLDSVSVNSEVRRKRLLAELDIIAFSDVTDYFKREEIVVDDFDPDTGNPKEPYEKKSEMKLKEELGDRSRAIQSIDETSLGFGKLRTKYKLYDKVKAIELIAKIEGHAKPEQHEHDLKNSDGSLKPVHRTVFMIPPNGRVKGK